ncbi:MAG: DNA topoisomerase I [Alphaproteobacteria bacterium]|nr:DNA topoisomerase I [Alphaproteobacteria bacterium]|tara:strand:+ start:750 stop:3410 length:2661 start_codon:yes stop_codon:yes gene_type:complete
MNVVVVESPSKAKTINKYLGDAYTVLASYGHVRDLPPKDGSVRPDEDFEMDWAVDDRSEKQIKAIVDALDGAETLYLATDPDREGEAISWHIEQMLRERGLLEDIDVKRVVFNEITKGAVQDAFNHPRGLNDELVEAYLARRALDYLVGFNLSPVLWRKLPGSRSAGRVQSVALRLICEREAEIEAFKPREYWTIEVGLDSTKGAPYQARLVERNGRKLERFDLANEAAATAAKSDVEAASFKIGSIEKKRTRRNPQPPFTTSTLQQEASRKLGFGASQTMRVAQRLYEGVEIDGETVGLITYMRTDSVTLSQDAIAASRDLIDQDFGGDYLPEKPRVYRTRAKNAQEAHEAVRPTDLFRRPASLKSALDSDLFRLYELIWRRTIASEMAEAQIDRVAVDLRSADGQLALRANGQTIAFDGFLKLYREDRDDPSNGEGENNENDDERRLPPLEEGEASNVREVVPDQHFTQPPPRYSEASLVKSMEELGIGRPSTYASIIQVLQDRKYVQLDRKRFVPEDQGRLVTSFLSSFFERYVQYDFTAQMEEQLDDISGGRIDWKAVLREFWRDFSAAIEGTAELRVRSVLDALDEELGPHFFPTREDGTDARVCPACSEGRLGLRIGKHGPFVGCSNYPECKYTRKLAVDGGDDETADLANGPRELGLDPETGKDVTLRKGPYGLYVQLGEPEGEGKKATKPKRSSIPDGYTLDEIDLALALSLLALPRDIGPHPEDGVVIQAGLGRYGPYVKHGTVYASLPEPREVLTVGLNRAVTVLAEKGKGRRGRAAPLKELGNHPDDEKPIAIYNGRYGPYVKHGKINATIPKDMDPESVSVEQALELIAAKAAKAKTKKAPAKKKTAAKKKTTKKTAAKKKPGAKKADTAPSAD